MLFSLFPVFHSDKVWSLQLLSWVLGLTLCYHDDCRVYAHSLVWTGISEAEVLVLPAAVLRCDANQWRTPSLLWQARRVQYPACAEKGLWYKP